jgi:hypothetical protein
MHDASDTEGRGRTRTALVAAGTGSAGAGEASVPKRCLYRIDDNALVACGRTRRDFFRVDDDTPWAHESHEWLVEAGSGVALAHRTGNVYYSAQSGEALYYEATEPG